jgi:nucleoside-diphosphate-sugar epimerase
MNILVTGGGGFIGGALIRSLNKRDYHVRNFSRKKYDFLEELGVEQITGDLRNMYEIDHATKNIDIVFHVAAKVGLWGKYEDFYEVNVRGTKQLIESCRKNGVKHLVFTSSASVVFAGKSIINGDESLPYPNKPESYYAGTKAIAEQLVLKANDKDLKTMALRPHIVWGPGDTHIIPGILERVNKRKIFQLGRDVYLTDTTYIDNYTHAQVQAMEALMTGKAEGQAYFISNGEPVRIWQFINSILEIYGYAPLNKKVPVYLAKFAGFMTENFYKIFLPSKEPTLTLFAIKELCSSHFFKLDKAKNELDYKPPVTTSQGLEILKESLF